MPDVKEYYSHKDVLFRRAGEARFAVHNHRVVPNRKLLHEHMQAELEGLEPLSTNPYLILPTIVSKLGNGNIAYLSKLYLLNLF